MLGIGRTQVNWDAFFLLKILIEFSSLTVIKRELFPISLVNFIEAILFLNVVLKIVV